MKDELIHKIGYWEKHQELDKFNYQSNRNEINTIKTIFASSFVVVASIAISSIADGNTKFGIFLLLSSIIGFPVANRYLLSKNEDESKKNETGFRIREAMLRNYYQDLDIDTDKLDRQFDTIKKIIQSKKLSNKQLEIIANGVMSKIN